MQLRFTFCMLLLSLLAISTQAQNTFPSTGNVGIGTTSPLKTLHVNGFGAFGNRVTTSNATRALNLADVDAVMRVLRVHSSYAPAVELISRTSADGANVAYWDFYAEPSDKSFRIRDRTGGGSGLDRVTIKSTGNVGIGTTTPSQKLHVVGNGNFTGNLYLSEKLFLQSKLFLHARGKENTFIGDSVGTSVFTDDFSGDGSRNTGVGTRALYHLTLGYRNTASGYGALYENTEGTFNTASGSYALYKNTLGSQNTASGNYALDFNTTGSHNTAGGSYALYYNISGNRNTALGYFAGVPYEYGNLSNTTAIGNGATVDASNKVRIGNSSVTKIGGQVSWTTFSDGRYKRNIQEDVQGLTFINSLRPITYTVDVQGLNGHYNKGRKEPEDENRRAAEEKASAMMKESEEKAGKIIYSGFMAQEVEQAAKKLKYEFSGVDRPQSEDGLYGLRYSDFVVPLVKAVQELSKKTDEIKELRKENTEIKQQLAELKQLVSKLAGGQNINTSLSGGALLQNVPNPVRGTTSIQYSLPEGANRSQLLLTDALGRTIKAVQLASSGVINVDVSSLSSGVYNYSLVVDGKTLQTKKMTVKQ